MWVSVPGQWQLAVSSASVPVTSSGSASESGARSLKAATNSNFNCWGSTPVMVIPVLGTRIYYGYVLLEVWSLD